ncbi:Hypothetical protein KVN_LOCUS343 [uncultured virus]|nr:Hypothetical protein KVN_LOCUS343 [uncultured virus]
MKEYKCNRCDKLFIQNIDLMRHNKKKYPCKKSRKNSAELRPILKNQNISNENSFEENNIQKFKCNYCGKYFTRKDSLERHIELRCSIKKQQENQKEQIFNKLLDEMKKQNEKLEEIEKQNQELKKEINYIKTKKKIIKNVNNGTINNVNNTLDQSNNINTFNIQLVAYGKEDYDKLTEKEYRIIINKGFKSVQEMVKSLHFNKNRPENHNIYISNIRDNNIMIYDGNKWELRNRKETIEELYIAKKDILVEKFDELINKLPTYAIDKFERFINDVQDNKIKEVILEELKLILYNNKNIATKTKEKWGLLNNPKFLTKKIIY